MFSRPCQVDFARFQRWRHRSLQNFGLSPVCLRTCQKKVAAPFARCKTSAIHGGHGDFHKHKASHTHANPPRRPWNWDKERRRIARMAFSWVNKHPELLATLPADILGEYGRIMQNGGVPYLHWNRERKGWWVKDNSSSRASRRSTSSIPLAASEWLGRELPPAVPILGAWMTTTSRILLSADTGIGKTNVCMAIAGHAAAGVDFLHWHAYQPARVLYVDGEMSRRLLKERIEDLARRLGFTPEGLNFLSREDFENFEPLNTPAGMMFLSTVLNQLGKIDFIIFDNCMALTSGKQAEEDSWTKTLPLVSSLTKRQVGQLWINHTGHNTERSYGTKTREWRMDTTIHLTAVERSDADISFNWEFRKARERTPQNRADFVDAAIALVNDRWVGSGEAARRRGKPSDQEPGLLRVLDELTKGPTMVMHRGCVAVDSDTWRDACLQRTLLEPAGPGWHRKTSSNVTGNWLGKLKKVANTKNTTKLCRAPALRNKPATNACNFLALCCRPVGDLDRSYDSDLSH